MNENEYVKRELRISLRKSGESAKQTREALEAAQAKLGEAASRADGTDAALVEIAGLMDTALTCVDEQNAALVEIAGMVAEMAETNEGSVA